MNGDKMKFYEVQPAFNNGKKVKSKKFGTFFFKDAHLYYEHGKLIEPIQGFAISVILSDDWEIIEDIPEVPIKITVSETFTCPSCKTSDEYWPSNKEDVAILGYFTCGKCGKKIKPALPPEEEILSYLKTELGIEFKSYFNTKNAIDEILIHPPESIIFANGRGYDIKYVKES